jgi:hypothetical protein
MKVRVLFVLCVVAGVTGCLPNAAVISSGKIGCPPEQITVTNDETGFGTRSWVATCDGKTYYCSVGGTSVSCAPAKAK